MYIDRRKEGAGITASDLLETKNKTKKKQTNCMV
jgi:hypothetical protein